MTAQLEEILHYNGEYLSMCTEPLSAYFAMGGIDPGFEPSSTALWRGYVGSWDIVNDRLYLVGICGTLKGGGEASVSTMFPDFPDRVFAHWYSGTIRIPNGNKLESVHMGYEGINEQDLLLDMKRGIVQKTCVRHNEKAEFADTSEGDDVNSIAVLPPASKGDREG